VPSTAPELTTRICRVEPSAIGRSTLFDEEQAAAELPTLRAIASADIHNLVFQRDYHIIPAMVSGRTP